MEPGAIAEHHGRSQTTIENIGRRWWRARDELLVFAAANPSVEVAAVGNALAEAIAHAWTSMTSLNGVLQSSDAPGEGTYKSLLERATDDHTHAVTLAEEFERKTRKEAAPAG